MRMRQTDDLSLTPDMARRIPTSGETGFAMIAVTLLTAVLLTLALVAFSDTSVSQTSAITAAVSVQADASANAGVSAAVYDIESGNFYCTPPSGTMGLLTPAAGGPANAGTDSYTWSVVYSGSGGTTDACSTNQATSAPVSAVVTSVGTSTVGAATSSETISESVDVSPVPAQQYTIFSGSNVNLTDVQLNQSTGTPTEFGELYTTGTVTTPSSGACPKQQVDITAAGSVTVADNCEIAGSVLSGGSVTLSQGKIDAAVTAANGNVTMSNSTISGNASAGGSSGGTNGEIWLCPQKNLTGACSGLSTGPNTIGGGANANNTVELGSVYEGCNATTATCPTSCSTATKENSNGDNNTVTGCITYDNPTEVHPPPTLPFPTFQNPPQSVWTAAGYTSYETPSVCTGTSAGSVLYDMENATANTVIVPTCTLSLTTNPSSSITLPDYNIVVVAPGINLGSGVQFKGPNPQASGILPQVSFVVPGPSSGGSCASSNNLTISASNALPSNNMEVLLYTACTFSITQNVNILGTILAGTFPTLSDQLQLTAVNQLTLPPGLTFGYQAAVVGRYVSAT